VLRSFTGRFAGFPKTMDRFADREYTGWRDRGCMDGLARHLGTGGVDELEINWRESIGNSRHQAGG
jgi:hypothetical protein